MPAAAEAAPRVVPFASGRDAGTPVSVDEFARAMAAFAPLETGFVLALAVSGGPDSLALLHLAREWADAHGGTVVALTVDHALRRASAAEADFVGRAAARLGVSHQTLAWTGAKPASNVAAAARAARYALLEDWCAARGIVHLATAHTEDDQAETVLMRLARGSGVSGLSAMAPATALGSVRLLRPLLGFPKARLVATLAAREQDWIDDPTNADPAFARPRLRAQAEALLGIGLAPSRLADTALVMARARDALHAAAARLLAEAVSLAPDGTAMIRPAAFVAAPREIGLRALSRVIATIGGLDFPPRAGRLETLLDALAAPGDWHGRTLGGCRIVRAPRQTDSRLLVARELAALPPSVSLGADGAARWDRFVVRVTPSGTLERLTLGALGGEGWLRLKRAAPELAGRRPGIVARALPALRDGDELVAVPHLDWRAAGRGGAWEAARISVDFRPPTALLR